MSAGTPPRLPKSTRDLILDEALRCFAERGYEGTSLNDIAAGVGIRRPSLLHHFGSKEVLYGDVFERILSEWMERLDVAVAERASGWDKCELVIRSGFELFAENPDYVRVMRREALDGGSHLGVDLAAVLKPYVDEASRWFAEQMDQGVFRRHEPRQLLITGYGAVLTYFSDAPFIDGLIEGSALTKDKIAEHCDSVVALFKSALVG